MLELIGFLALAYIIVRFLPSIVEYLFKFSVICLGFLAFLITANWILYHVF
jgi:hypothetical protein